MASFLKFLSGPARGASIELTDQPLTFGRGDLVCQVILPSTKISREHARITQDQAKFYLEDLRSGNGTYINGKRVLGRQLLRHGDQVHFADILAVFRDSEADDASKITQNVQAALPLAVQAEEPLPKILNAVNSGSDSQIDINAQAKLSAVLQMINKLGVSLDVDQMLANTLDAMFSLYPQTDRGYILFPDGAHGTLTMRGEKKRHTGHSEVLGPINFRLANWAISKAQAVLATDFDRSVSVLEAAPRSIMCIPLSGPRHKHVGAVCLETCAAAAQYTEDDLRALVSICRIAGQAAEYAREHEVILAENDRYIAELKRSNEDLQHFASAASHDLQEPLRAVSGYLQLLRELGEEATAEQTHAYIQEALSASQRMQTLITGLLQYSRVTTNAKEFAPTDCNVVLAQALANLDAAIRESGAVITSDRLPTVPGDASQLLQLFQNLVGNAIKYRRPEAAPRIHVTAKSRQAGIEFLVRDNGIGIEPQYSQRVFEIFQRLHSQEKYSGAGVGLAICKKVVARHKGRIWFDSSPDNGCTFHFTLSR